MIAILICVAWCVLAGVAVAELHEWRLPRREPEVESKEGVHFLVLHKQRTREVYVFLFDDAHAVDAMRTYAVGRGRWWRGEIRLATFRTRYKMRAAEVVVHPCCSDHLEPE
jgi:hypothetical protein